MSTKLQNRLCNHKSLIQPDSDLVMAEVRLYLGCAKIGRNENN